MQETMKQVDVAVLVPSKTNRADIGKENGELTELTESVRANGILIPLIVRPQRDKSKGIEYEIVAGHRRWWAAQKADLKTIPCVVREMDDSLAMQVQIIENLQRKNLTALEEARAFQMLQAAAPCDVASLSKMVDKSEKYVHRALKLLTLPKDAIKALENKMITAAHAHQLLRVGDKQMDTIVKYAITKGYRDQVPSVSDLEHYITQRMSKNLAEAPFPKDCAYGSKIACTACPYNTGNQGTLFDGAEAGHCTDGNCYASKTREFYRQMSESGKRKWDGLKFIGTAREGWQGQVMHVKGYYVIDEKKAAKELKAHPEKFGFGIITPGHYGGIKSPKLVLVTKDKTLAGVKERDNEYQQDPDEQYHWKFVRDYTAEKTQSERDALEKLQDALYKREEVEQKNAEKVWKKKKVEIIQAYKADAEKKAAAVKES